MSRTTPRLPFVLLCALLGCALAHSLWLIRPFGGEYAALVCKALYLGVMYSGAALCWTAAARADRAARAWRLFAGGVLSYAAADTLFLLIESVLGHTPTPSPADPLYLAYYPLIVLGLLALPSRPLGRAEAVRLGLDVGVIVGSLGVLGWYGLFAAVVLDPNSTLVAKLINLAYPVCDLMTLSLLFMVMRRGRRFRLEVLLLAVGLVSFIVADVVYLYTDATVGYVSGQFNDALWTWGTALFGVGAWTAGRGREGVVAQRVSRVTGGLGAHLLPLLPYLGLGASFALLLATLDQGTLASHGVAWGTAAVTLLVAARQAVALTENAGLSLALGQANAALEERVKVRTAELEDSRAALAHQAQHDALTGLPNRAFFLERLESALADAARAHTPLGVLFLDLDGFKHVNDTLGHAAGDVLLQEIARRLRGLVEGVGVSAWLGGDEFIVLLEGQGKDPALRLGRQVQEVLAAPFELLGRRVRVGVSVGVSLYPDHAADAAALYMYADTAMYRAKQAGRATVCLFTPEMNAEAHRRLDLESRLRGALERGELALHYQPMCGRGGEVRCFEALLRWTSPDLGVVAPDAFIPVAEDSGLIVPIGTWVLDRACAQLAAWHAGGHRTLRVSVNVSPAQFGREEFVDVVRETLGRHGLCGAALELELTERLIVEHPERAARTLTALHALGVAVALDDFGTGHSALGSLLHLPVQVLKIDKAFVRRLHEVDGAPRVVQAIVRMAHALGLEVVAEGVETRAQLDHVHLLGCERAQGFYLSCPLPAEGAERLLRELGRVRAATGATHERTA